MALLRQGLFALLSWWLCHQWVMVMARESLMISQFLAQQSLPDLLTETLGFLEPSSGASSASAFLPPPIDDHSDDQVDWSMLNATSGYLYYRYFPTAACVGDPVYFSGALSGVCHATASADASSFLSFKVVLYDVVSCANATMYYYHDEACMDELSHRHIAEMGQCQNNSDSMTSLSLPSLILSCSDDVIPITLPSVVTR
jgi:hypothetical protein